jgi:multidrug efflux pump subunit AcrB
MGGMSMGGLPGGLGGLLASLGGGLPGGSSITTGRKSSQTTIRVKDIARVSYQKKDRTEIARLNQMECIKVSIFKEGDANIVTVARAIHKAKQQLIEKHRIEARSPEWEKKLKSPGRRFRKLINAVSSLLINYRFFEIEEEEIKLEDGIGIEVISNQAVFITQAIYSVAQTAIWGALIAVLVLYVFLRNISSTLIVGLAIPISIITTFNLMFFQDITFNIMSLGGLALGVGLLVDNSIVVLENILRRRTFDPDAQASAERGAREVASAITASTLTNIMVFFPILYLEGMFRQIFGDLAWTVAFSLVCSEAVALSIVPMLTVVMGKTVRLPKELMDELDYPDGAAPPEEEPDDDPDDSAPDDGNGLSLYLSGSPMGLKNFREMRKAQYKKEGKVSFGFLLILFIDILIVHLALAPLMALSTKLYGLLAFQINSVLMLAAVLEIIVILIRRLTGKFDKDGEGRPDAANGEDALFRISTFLDYVIHLPLFIASKIAKYVWGVVSGGTGFIMRYPLMTFDAYFNRLKRWYPGMLRRLLTSPYTTGGVAVLIAAASAGILYLLGWELLPAVDQGEFRVRVELPTGTPINETNRRIGLMENKIGSIDRRGEFISSLFATVGIGTAEGEGTSEKSESIGEIHVSLKDRDRRDIVDEEVIARVMRSLRDEVEVVARSAKPQLLSYKTPVELEIDGADLVQLKKAAVLVIKEIHDVPGLLEIESSMTEKNPEINITIDRARASSLGLSVTEITDVVRRKVKGETPTRFDMADQQIDIVVELEEEDRATLDRLRRITIAGPAGDIRLDQVAAIRPGLGPAAITRSENSRVAIISANIHERPLGDIVADIEEKLEKVTLPPGTAWRITGQNEEMERSRGSLYLAVALAVILVYIVLAAQFESLFHPFVIMFCVPFSLVGLTVILILTGQTINIFSLIGMLMMIGIAVNDAIVLVTTINLRRDEGMERLEAIVDAGTSRLRPIMITTLTTALGMVPMALALGPGAELRAPMAITVIGGLTSSTFFTLTAIPCLYLVLDKILPRSYRPSVSQETFHEKLSKPLVEHFSIGTAETSDKSLDSRKPEAGKKQGADEEKDPSKDPSEE